MYVRMYVSMYVFMYVCMFGKKTLAVMEARLPFEPCGWRMRDCDYRLQVLFMCGKVDKRVVVITR